MKKVLRNIAAFYLGAALSIFANVNCFQWQFWVIVLPVVVLFAVADGE